NTRPSGVARTGVRRRGRPLRPRGLIRLEADRPGHRPPVGSSAAGQGKAQSDPAEEVREPHRSAVYPTEGHRANSPPVRGGGAFGLNEVLRDEPRSSSLPLEKAP